MIELRIEVKPAWVFRLPVRPAPDGLTRVRSRVLHRLLHAGEEPVLVRAAAIAPDRLLIGAWAETRGGALEAIERMGRALGCEDDVRAFHERFRWDPWLGRSIRSDPFLRPLRRPVAFEALAWAITEQLIEYERAAAIQRRMIHRLGRRCPRTGRRDAPEAAALAAAAPAELQAMDLAASRAVALIRAARLVASGRLDLEGCEHERGWRMLRSIPGIGAWTVEILALTGQGRLDQVPAGDLHLLRLVGRRLHDDPRARATEDEVRECFAPYAPWGGLAASYAAGPGAAGQRPASFRSPVRGGTRWSARSRHRAVA